MNKLYFWIALGLLGFLLYISPGYLVRRMYEGFVQNRQKQVVPTSVNGVDLPPSPAPASFNQIKNLQGILDTPAFDSPTAIPPVQNSNGGLTAQPKEFDSTSSKPASAYMNVSNDSSLNHGQAFIDNKPKDVKNAVAPAQCAPPTPAPSGLQPFTAEHAVQLANALQKSQIADSNLKRSCNSPAERVIVKREYVPEYIPVPTPAKCPDMRDYIRKDSIPCWACNLK